MHYMVGKYCSRKVRLNKSSKLAEVLAVQEVDTWFTRGLVEQINKLVKILDVPIGRLVQFQKIWLNNSSELVKVQAVPSLWFFIAFFISNHCVGNIWICHVLWAVSFQSWISFTHMDLPIISSNYFWWKWNQNITFSCITLHISVVQLWKYLNDSF